MNKRVYEVMIKRLHDIRKCLNPIYFGKCREDLTREQLQMIWNIIVTTDDLLDNLLNQIYDEK